MKLNKTHRRSLPIPGVFYLCIVAVLYVSGRLYAQSPDYIRYHQLINQAEMKIITNEFSQALPYYDTIYHQYDFIYARDCFYATQASVLAGDTCMAFKFLRKGFLQGLRQEDAEVDPILQDLKVHSSWNEMMYEYPSLHTAYLAKINLPLRKRLLPLYEMEQYYNELSDNATGAGYLPRVLRYKAKNRIIKDSLIHIIHTLGHFPGEQEIGVIDTSMYVFDSLNQKYFNPAKGRPYLHTHEYLILVHYYQLWGAKNYDSLLFSSVQQGYLLPEDYAFLSDNRGSKPRRFFYTPFLKMYRIFHKKSVSEKRKKKYHDLLNKNRSTIGFASLEQDQLRRNRIMWLREEWSKKNYRVIALD